jgi:hypothetical protein
MSAPNNFPPHTFHSCIAAYKTPPGYWANCPRCSLRPRVWVFDNGRFTACGCWNNTYDGFEITAESIGDVWRRTRRTAEYDADALRVAWNTYATGEVQL